MSCLAFFLSPLALIPSIFIQLSKKKDAGLILLTSSFFSVLSFNYIPNITNDKASHIIKVKDFSTYSFNDLIDYFDQTNSPDYIFNIAMFLFSRFDSGFNYLFFTLTFLTIFILLLCVKNTLRASFDFGFNNKIFLFFVFSISLGSLFSGVRFYFGVSLVLYSFYFLYVKENRKLFLVFFILSVLTHFSLIFFIIPVLFSRFKIPPKKLRLILAFSILFFMVPKDFISGILSSVSFTSGINDKIEAYKDWSRDISINYTILQSIRTLWYFIAVSYLIAYKKIGNDKMYSIIMAIFISINFISPIEIAFERYSIVASFVFLTFILSEYYRKKVKTHYLNIFIFLYFLSTVVDIYLLRLNFLNSYSVNNMLTLFHVFINGGVPLNLY